MPHSDPIVFAARAAALTDQQLCEEWKAEKRKFAEGVWQQALRDEMAARHLLTEPQSGLGRLQDIAISALSPAFGQPKTQ